MSTEVIDTNFHLPGQVGEVYTGKVGDVYNINHEVGQLIAVVRTDRISAFDAKFPEPVPHKGQVLNQMSAALLNETVQTAPNWLLATPDPNASVGLKADPIKVEMIVRGYLLGSAWQGYNKEGMRQLCDNTLPEGMHEFEPFEIPLITPTTKSEKDENITRQEIIDNGLATAEEYDEMVEIAFDLFELGQTMARERGLILADTKFEIGRIASGELVVIDEALTPDSSRYFPLDEYKAYLEGKTDVRPEQLSKEFLREWLKAQGFTNLPGQTRPELPDWLVRQISDRYIDLYERMLGKQFVLSLGNNPAERIEASLVAYLETL